MRILVQKLRDGVKEIVEIPDQYPEAGQILVKTSFSAISLGTELSTIKAAKASLLGKLKARPEQAVNVINTIKKHGFSYALNAVDKKLGALSPLGYSSCGKVIRVGSDVKEFNVGDLVACGGIGVAVHADNNIVPVNQAIRLNENVNLEIAALNSLGAISLQAIRLTSFGPGVKVCVLGYGLLGQLSAMLSEVSGADICVVDVNEGLKERAIECNHKFIKAESIDITAKNVKSLPNWSEGADIVLICAATNSNQPINMAGAISRQRGQVVIVGDVGTTFRRNPDFYRKEISIVISCSYGAGRYDPSYEDRGIDYPYGLVRWTAKRNMEAFHLLSQRHKSKFEKLIVKRTKFDDILNTYNDLELNGTDGFVLVEYADLRQINNPNKKVEKVLSPNCKQSEHDKKILVSVIGPGAYCQGTILPIINKEPNVLLRLVYSKTGLSALRVKRKYGFTNISESAESIFEDTESDIVFCTPRHDFHFDCVCLAISRKKRIFLEKPLCINEEQLAELHEIDEKVTVPNGLISLGYNRTFAPLYRHFRNAAEGSTFLHYEINAGSLPIDSWQITKECGGRIIGEVCHFVDLCCDFFNSIVAEVNADIIRGNHRGQDDFIITLTFASGSIASLHYFSSGFSSRYKEIVTARKNDSTWNLYDFQKITHNQRNNRSLWSADKGQKNMIKAVLGGSYINHRISNFQYLLHITKVTIAIESALMKKQSIEL